MGKISIHNVDLEELQDLQFEEKIKKRTKNGKFKENNNENDIHQSQWLSARGGEGDSFISKRRNTRS
jgi:hypothetical protein